MNKFKKEKVGAVLKLMKSKNVMFPENSVIEVSLKSTYHNFQQVSGSYHIYFQRRFDEDGKPKRVYYESCNLISNP